MSRDLYQEVTDKILAQLEAGTAPWVKPWTTVQPHGGAPYNITSGKPYRGINTLLLFAPHYPTAGWLTFKQARDIGANVRAGEHGSMIVFYKPFEVKDRNAQPAADGSQPSKLIPLLRHFTVFNIAQCDNVPAKYLPAVDERTEVERHAAADALLSQARIEHGGNGACYIPSADLIRMPEASQFRTVPEYYATALHELTHWTGAKHRLNRDFSGRFGDEHYAREELVAEMGAAFLCAHVGIAGQLQHAEYLASWIKVLKGDKRAIVQAAGAAQKAADLVTGYKVPETAEESAIAA